MSKHAQDFYPGDHLIGVACRAARVGIEALTDFVLPPICPLCERPLSPSLTGSIRCHDCDAEIPRPPGYCRRCSAPLGPYLTGDDCHHCRGERFAFESAFAVGEHGDLLREAVLKAQRPGGEATIRWLVDRLWDDRQADLKTLPIDVVTAVPQHWRRRLAGPHNTAELIGRRLAKRLQVAFEPSILVKRRHTPSQTSLSLTARRKNLRNAFRGRGGQAGGIVLLCDDVMTTGTTAHRCARALCEAGWEAVFVAVITRGLGLQSS